MMASVPVSSEPADPGPAPVPRSTVDLESAYREHYASLVRLASILVDDVGTCEEVVQEAFVRVWQRGGALRDADRLPAYLRSAVLNGARSYLRKVVVRRRHLSAVPPSPPASEPGAGRGAGPGAGTDVEAVGTDTGEGPEAGAVASDETRQVLAALRTLPDRQREVLALRYYLDLSEAEIAVTLGISPGSVKTHAHRGLAALTDRLEGLR